MTAPEFGKPLGTTHEKIRGCDPSDVNGVSDAAYGARQAVAAVADKTNGIASNLDDLTLNLDKVTKAVERIKKAVVGVDSWKIGLDAAAEDIRYQLNNDKNITFYRHDLDRLDEVFTEFVSLLEPILDEAQKRGVPVPPLFWFYMQSVQSFIARIDW